MDAGRLDLYEFLLHQRENIGVAAWRQWLPEFLPDTPRGPQAKTVVGRDERTLHDLGHAAILHTQQCVGVIYGNHEGGVDEAATINEPGIAVHQAGDVIDHASCSLRMVQRGMTR